MVDYASELLVASPVQVQNCEKSTLKCAKPTNILSQTKFTIKDGENFIYSKCPRLILLLSWSNVDHLSQVLNTRWPHEW